MVTIDEVRTDIEVQPSTSQHQGVPPSGDQLKETLRPLVRALLREELERHLRTEVRR